MRVFLEARLLRHTNARPDEGRGRQKQSLYCAFGEKRSLFLKCLNLYTRQFLLEIQKMPNGEGSPLEGIERVMQFASETPDPENSPPGCLMANTALELGTEDPCGAEEMRRMFRGIEKMLGAAVRKAQKQGQISKNFDCVVGQSLANTFSGIRILERPVRPNNKSAP